MPNRIGMINQAPDVYLPSSNSRRIRSFRQCFDSNHRRSVYNKNGYEQKLGEENKDHNRYKAKRKKATCDFYSSNKQKNEVNHSDPLFLAEKASVSKDDRTSNEKGTIVTRLLLRAADDKAASIRSATAYAEDYVKRLYEQSGRQIASIRYRTWPVYPTDDVCQKGQCNVQCRTSKEAFDAD